MTTLAVAVMTAALFACGESSGSDDEADTSAAIPATDTAASSAPPLAPFTVAAIDSLVARWGIPEKRDFDPTRKNGVTVWWGRISSARWSASADNWTGEYTNRSVMLGDNRQLEDYNRRARRLGR